MLCYTIVNFVIQFESIYICTVLQKIWQIIQICKPDIKKSAHLFVLKSKINLHWTSFSGFINVGAQSPLDMRRAAQSLLIN